MYKPGQFIKTPFGRMRVCKSENGWYPTETCRKCALRDYKKCAEFENMYGIRCVKIITKDCYLKKV